MIKKIIATGLCLSLTVGMAACSVQDSNAETRTVTIGTTEGAAGGSTESSTQGVEADSSEQAATETAETADPAAGSNMLVVYFSRVGITDLSGSVDAVSSASIVEENGSYRGNATILADMIADQTGADRFQIITEAVYPTAYRDTTDLARTEQSQNARPALSSHVENMDQYDFVFMVYPNWWGDLPMPVYTFLEEYDWSGKTIAPLATHGGSGLSQTEATIAELTGATVINGLTVSAGAVTSAQPEVVSWIAGMDLPAAAVSETTAAAAQGEAENMNIRINDNTYTVALESNVTVDELAANMPLELNMVRYAGHEYYAELPFTPAMASETTSEILAGHVYYWDGWNAFVINYEDTNISPYQVVRVGAITDAGISDYLQAAEENLTIVIE